MKWTHLLLVIWLAPVAVGHAALLQFDFAGITTAHIPEHGSEYTGSVVIDSVNKQVEAVFATSGPADYVWLHSDPNHVGRWTVPWLTYDRDQGFYSLMLEGATQGVNKADNDFYLFIDIELAGPELALQREDYGQMFIAEYVAMASFVNDDQATEAPMQRLAMSVIDQVPVIDAPAPASLPLFLLLAFAGRWCRKSLPW